MPQVLNANDVGTQENKSRVYVARPSKWGNPYFIGPDGTRAEVIAKYADYIVRQPELMASLHELRGRDLICFCVPEQCHAEILLRLANGKADEAVVAD